MTFVGATVASVWGDILYHPDDEAVLDGTLACVCRMYSAWDGLSGWAGSRKMCPGTCNRSGMRFPNGATSGNCVPFRRQILGHAFRMQKRPHDVAFNLYICCGYPPMTSRAPTTGRLSGRQNIRFIASSARKGGRLMWPPLRRTVRAGNLICLRPDRRFSYELAASRYLILVVPGARLGSVSLASVWKCSVYTFLPSRNIS